MPDRKINFCSKFAVKTLPCCSCYTYIGNPKSLHTFLTKCLYHHVLVKFEQHRMVQTTLNFEFFDKSRTKQKTNKETNKERNKQTNKQPHSPKLRCGVCVCQTLWVDQKKTPQCSVHTCHTPHNVASYVNTYIYTLHKIYMCIYTLWGGS